MPPIFRGRRAMGTLSWSLFGAIGSSSVAALLLITGIPIGDLVAPSGSDASGSNGISPSPTSCTSNTRAARSISTPGPHFALSKGDSMSVWYEFQVYSTTLSSIHFRVYAPSLFGQFTEANGTTLSFYIAPRVFVLNSTAWTNASAALAKQTINFPITFNTSRPGFLTSQLLSIMATAPLSTLQLSLRWQWSVTFVSNGTTVTSPWSRITTTGTNPTVFSPAPYVQLVSKTATTIPIGGFFTAYLLGAVSNTAFGSELEYASSGNVIRVNHTYTPNGNTTPVGVGIQILPSANAPFAPTKMLNHIHNICGSMLYSISITPVYSAHANVTIGVRPTSCGSVTFNGSSLANGSVTTITPSAASLSLGAPSCAGHTFSTWIRTDGVSVASLTAASTTAIVSASGTVTASYT